MWGTSVELADDYSTELEEGRRSVVLQSELLPSSARAATQTESWSLSMRLAGEYVQRSAGMPVSNFYCLLLKELRILHIAVRMRRTDLSN